MDEYISREALLAEIAADYGNWTACNDTDESYCQGVRDNFDDTIRLINELPAADVQPVKHGRWIEKEAYEEDRQMGFNFQIVCSNCDEQNSVLCSFDENSEPTEKYFMRTPWCPWCGAKMDFKDGDE